MVRVGLIGAKGIDALIEEATSGRCECVSLLPEKKLSIRLLNNIYWGTYFSLKCLKADVVYFTFIGPWVKYCAKVANLLRKKVVFHWAGTDVYTLIQGNLQAQKWSCRVDLHLSYGQNLTEELATMGIHAQAMPIPPSTPEVKSKMPDEHAVLLSIPDSRADFYGYQTMLEVIRLFPNIKFVVVRAQEKARYNEPNVDFRGVVSKEEMNSVYDDVSIVLRYPEHDGTSLLLMESLLRGKRLISRFAFPFAQQVEGIDEISLALKKCLEEPLIPDENGINYAEENFNSQKFAADFMKNIYDVLGHDENS